MKKLAQLIQHKLTPTNIFVAWGVLLLLTLALCGHVLFSGDLIFGAPGTDIPQQFIAWRNFGFKEISAWNVPLWNPHIYGGAPYLGGFQAALMYPLNWPLFMLMDTRVAINTSIVLHCFLMGAFTDAWLRQADISPLAALMGGGLAILAGTYISHVYAGHLPNLCAMVWLPLILKAVDGVLISDEQEQNRSLKQTRSVLLGAFALAMQVFAGHPQYVMISVIAITAYSIIQIYNKKIQWKIAINLIVMFSLGVGLSAVQLIPSIVAGGETIRSRALQESFAAMFSLPVENLITLAMPNVFGGFQLQPYFGRWYYWEVCLYLGSGSLLVCVLGIRGGGSGANQAKTNDEIKNRHRGLLGMGMLTLAIALGNATSLHHFLYVNVPGFDRVRGMSKFAYATTFVVIYFSSKGYDVLNKNSARKLAMLAACCACISYSISIVFEWSRQNPLIEWIGASKESYLFESAKQRLSEDTLLSFENQAGLAIAGAFNRWGVEMAAWTALLLLISKRVKYKPLVILGAMLPVFIWAQGAMGFTSYSEQISLWNVPLDALDGKYRVADQINKNSSMYTGALEVSGNDPGVTTRYAELLAAIEGRNPSEASQYIDILQPHALHVLLRLKYVRQASPNGFSEWLSVLDPPMPQFTLMSKYSVKRGRDEVLAHMLSPEFDPRNEVVLEQEPYPVPELGGRGVVKMAKCKADYCVVEASIEKPMLLLMTDAWSPSWQVRSYSESGTQNSYQIQPGDHAFRVIALEAGEHKLNIYYSRTAFYIGGIISSAVLVVFIYILGLNFRPINSRSRKKVHTA
ncbi:hypothetical protein [Rhodoferax sp. TH121]|uniref:hypothetical protein n=1 Tax=Rhodoferax sp. TH121 TaxID=2022803 RepID=UPI0011404834|nr:hypothetical protein [Rhodoferax sp. TH121]